MPIDVTLNNEGAKAPEKIAGFRRSHPRVPIEARVVLVRFGIPEPVIVRSMDLSWGGASLLVSGKGVDVDDLVALRFPWGQRGSFSAQAKVVWKHPIDDQQNLVGVSFFKLRVRDEKKLEQLLSMLLQSGEAEKHEVSVGRGLEIFFLDDDEMRDALEQIRLGRMNTVVFQPYRTSERIPLVLTAPGDLLTLHLRARIASQNALVSESDPPASTVFQVQLVLDHPDDDLKRVADEVIARLDADRHADSVAVA